MFIKFNKNVDEGVASVLRLNGAFRVFCKLAIWHENRELRASAMMAVANLMVNGIILKIFIFFYIFHFSNSFILLYILFLLLFYF